MIEPHSVPDFLAEKIPFVKLGTTDEIGLPGNVHAMPRYDHPEFLKAFKEMDDLLAEHYNGHPQIEFVDTCMYGFWAEGHTWPYQGKWVFGSGVSETQRRKAGHDHFTTGS